MGVDIDYYFDHDIPLWEGKTIEEAITIAKANNSRCQVVSFSDKVDTYSSLDIIINEKWENK